MKILQTLLLNCGAQKVDMGCYFYQPRGASYNSWAQFSNLTGEVPAPPSHWHCGSQFACYKRGRASQEVANHACKLEKQIWPISPAGLQSK